MNNVAKKIALSGMILLFAGGLLAISQERAQDKRKALDPKAQTTDDPRRIPVAPGASGPQGVLVLRGGRVFDGTGAPARPGTLVIRRNKIEKILPAESSDWPKEARVIELGGKTVLPGLIDAHVHIDYRNLDTPAPMVADEADAMLRAVERARVFLESGITSVRDVGSHGFVPFRLKAWISENRVAGPRVFPAGAFITSTGGHGAEGEEGTSLSIGTRVAEGPDDWRDRKSTRLNSSH